MKQARNIEELTSGQMTLEEARNVMCLRNNPEDKFPAWAG